MHEVKSDGQGTDIYIFRHGETDWNRSGRWQGHRDIALNALGVAQAHEVVEFLRHLRLDGLLSSDLLRAHQTAGIVGAALELPVILNEGLREMNLGEAEGMDNSEIILNFGETSLCQMRSTERDSSDFRFPGGESKVEVLNRVFSALLREVAVQKWRRMGVATHGGVIRVLLTHCGVGDGPHIANGAIAHFRLPVGKLSIQENAIGKGAER